MKFRLNQMMGQSYLGPVAEVVLFVVGGHVFAACVHGEFDAAFRARTPMMAVLKTAQMPP